MISQKKLAKYFLLRAKHVFTFREGVVLRAIMEFPCCTENELANKLGQLRDDIRARKNRLHSLGLIGPVSKRICTISNKLSNIWAVKSLDISDLKTYKLKQRRCICSTCKGKGYVIKVAF